MNLFLIIAKMIFEIFIRLDVLFNNSGIATDGTKPPERIHELSVQEYRQFMSINADGQVFVMQPVLKLMIEVSNLI
jgi:NAD(P)-dependent dehydrogenase (short-subunit alcohol dehydrogenase family)